MKKNIHCLAALMVCLFSPLVLSASPLPGSPPVADNASPPSPPATRVPPPLAHEVKALLEKRYRAPALHSLTPVRESDRAVKWVRRYDGVEMLSETKTVLVDGKAWETRWDRELAEPEPVRRGDLISDQRAAEASGLSREFSENRLHTRLVYDPVYVEVPKTAHVENATDVEWVIQKYRLAIEVINPADSTLDLVDAYTGEAFLHDSGRVDSRIAVQGRQYPLVTIDADATGAASTIVLRDPVRVSRHALDRSPINGQGIVDGLPTGMADLTYTYLNYSRVNADAAFAISQAWDFFKFAFGRRGLRDLPELALEPVQRCGRCLRQECDPTQRLLIVRPLDRNRQWHHHSQQWGPELRQPGQSRDLGT